MIRLSAMLVAVDYSRVSKFYFRRRIRGCLCFEFGEKGEGQKKMRERRLHSL